MKKKKESTIRMRLAPNEAARVIQSRDKTVENVLVIGDLHEPFCLEKI